MVVRFFRKLIQAGKSEKTRYRLLLIALLLTGAGLAALPWKNWILFASHPDLSEIAIHLIVAIGEAMAVAAVIAIFVDEYEKDKFAKELVEEFTTHVSDHIVGRLLPATLREQLHEYLTVGFVRRTWDVTYNLQWKTPVGPSGAAGARYVKLSTTSEYEMENCSPLDHDYRIGFEVVQRWFTNLPDPEITDVTIDGHSINSGMTKSEGGFLKLDPGSNSALIVRMRGKSPNGPAPVRIKLNSVEHLGDTFYTSFEALYPVLHTTVRVRRPQDMEVALYLSFADNTEAQPVKPLDAGFQEQWTITRPILTGQGILLRWRPSPFTPPHGPKL
jgi:hypothetical protein